MQAHSVSLKSQVYNNKMMPQRIEGQSFCASSSKEDKSKKVKIALTSFAGAILPIILINALKKGRINDITSAFKDKLPIKDKAKSISKLFEIESIGQIFASTTGGVLGGVLMGRKGVKKEEKKQIYKEGIFQFANAMIPATFVFGSMKGLEKIGKGKSAPLKAIAILASVISGMFVANKTTNALNTKTFDKYDKNAKKRPFKLKDSIVHIDDLVAVAVLAKIPFAQTLQIDKILPLLYAKIGYESGTAKKEENA